MFGNLTLISVNTGIFVKTNNQPKEDENCVEEIVFHQL